MSLVGFVQVGAHPGRLWTHVFTPQGVGEFGCGDSGTGRFRPVVVGQAHREMCQLLC